MLRNTPAIALSLAVSLSAFGSGNSNNGHSNNGHQNNGHSHHNHHGYGPEPDEEYRFGYLFPHLNPLDIPNEILKEIGKPSSDTAVPAYFEDSQVRGTDNNSANEVGLTYVGQLLAHDISLDSESVLGQVNNAWTLLNHASPWLDLDTLYEFDGVHAARDPRDRAKLLMGNFLGNERDFARTLDGHAIVVDRRNDENNNVAQLCGIFLQLHNVFVDQLRSEGVPESRLFAAARREVELHWQAIILSEFLPSVLDPDVLADVLAHGRRFYGNAYSRRGIVPVEFSAAASRFGHSMVRGRYTLNEAFPTVRLFPLSESELSRNLMGGQVIPPERQIEWKRFFLLDSSTSGDTGDNEGQFDGLQVARKIDRLLARPMLRLPVGAPGIPDFILDTENTVAGLPTMSLGSLSLFRSKALGLASGQAVAAAMGVTPLDISVFEFCGPGEPCTIDGIALDDPPTEAPLFLYVLQEATEQNDGEKLGAVGSRIVGEVVIGLLESDRTSILNRSFVSRITSDGYVGMADVIEYIGWDE